MKSSRKSVNGNIFVGFNLCGSSSIPPQYVGRHSVQTEGSSDVVIVVPEHDPTDRTDSILLNRIAHEHAVCIDPDADIMDPNSPKTITESSSN